MFRAVVAVIVGYVASILVMFVLFSGLYMVLGPSGTYEPGTWVLSQKWTTAQVPITLISAIAAGWVCAAIAKTGRPPTVLALLMVIFGVVNALMMMKMGQKDLGPRPDQVALLDAMQKHQEPLWLGWAYPVLAAIGVSIGARRKKKS